MTPQRALMDHIRSEYGSRLYVKPTPLMWLLQIGLWIITFGLHRGFMDRYCTAVGFDLYFERGTSLDPDSPEAPDLITLAHEIQHLEDKRTDGVWTYFSRYLRRKWRAHYELRAYNMSNAIRIRFGEGMREPLPRQVEMFADSSYWWMDRDRDKVRAQLQANIDACNARRFSPLQQRVIEIIAAKVSP